jgi:hypothetical protein
MKRKKPLPKIKCDVTLDSSIVIGKLVEAIGVKQMLKLMLVHCFMEYSSNLVMPFGFGAGKYKEENTQACMLLMHVLKSWDKLMPEAVKTYDAAYIKAEAEKHAEDRALFERLNNDTQKTVAKNSRA